MNDLSIIIPVYQAEKHIGECLESLLCQHLNIREIICIDDGSTDHSAKIIKEYIRKYPLIQYYYQKNQGVSSARNQGMQLAKGNYVLFVDADDVIQKRTLGKLLAKIQQSQAEILVFGGHAKNFFSTQEWVKDAFFTRNTVYTKNSIQALFHESGARPSVCNKIFLRELLQTVSFPESIMISEDLAFLFDVFPNAEKIVFSSKNVYRYRVSNKESAMHRIEKTPDLLFENHLRTVEYVLQLWKKKGIFEKEQAELREWVAAFLEYIYILLPEMDKAKFIPRLRKISCCLNISEKKVDLDQKSLSKQKLIKKIGKSLCYQFRRYGLKFGIYSILLKIYGRVKND